MLLIVLMVIVVAMEWKRLGLPWQDKLPFGVTCFVLGFVVALEIATQLNRRLRRRRGWAERD